MGPRRPSTGDGWRSKRSYFRLNFVGLRLHVGLPPSEERRERVRFPVSLAVDYRTLGRENNHGAGQTVNISSAGVLFTGPHQFAIGQCIELTINWPFQLDGAIPLQLRIRGRVVRVTANQTAITIDRHEFRTTRRPGASDTARPAKSHLTG